MLSLQHYITNIICSIYISYSR